LAKDFTKITEAILFMTILQPYVRNLWDFVSQAYPLNRFIN